MQESGQINIPVLLIRQAKGGSEALGLTCHPLAMVAGGRVASGQGFRKGRHQSADFILLSSCPGPLFQTSKTSGCCRKDQETDHFSSLTHPLHRDW